MRWRKLGRVYGPDGSQWWARTHAFMPTTYLIDDRLRVYFAGLDEQSIGRVGYVDLDPTDPRNVLGASESPVLDVGALGAFDDSGVNPSCVVQALDSLRMYYIGWQRTQRVPYMLFSGLATSNDEGNTFQRVQRTPVLDRTPDEPFSRSAPFVVQENGILRAWYWSCREWSVEESASGRWVHYNNEIRCAISEDGLYWQATAAPCVEPRADEYSVGRPWVLRDANRYRMWYSVRSRSRAYRLGYAESFDGLNWTRRDDEVGLEVSDQGWDCEMVAFPCVVDSAGQRLLFYNGNGNGRTGFGVAVLEQD